MSNPIDVQVGQIIRDVRTLNGRSQRALAKSVGLSYQQLHKYETGKNRVSVSTLIEIAAQFGLQGTDLMPTVDGPLDGLQMMHGSLELHRAFQSITDPIRRELVLSIVRGFLQ